MTTTERLNSDLKQAMLAGDKVLVTTLRGLKSTILYAEVAKGNREQGLADAEVMDLLGKEAKKRQESADLFTRGGNAQKAAEELAEKQVIEKYLPAQISDDELGALVDTAVAELGASGPQAMGQVIGLVKQRSNGQADGGRIAAAVKARIG